MLIKEADDPRLKARIRRHLRNPSMLTVFILVVVALAIPIGIAYPTVSSLAKENWTDVQNARARQFVNVTAASWIYPFLRRQALRMQEAEVPGEWRAVSFKTGACFPEHMSQLPVGKYTYAVETACTTLDEIQMKYAADCAQTRACNIPDQAKFDLQVVLDRLRVAFSDANFVQPVTDDQGQIRD